MSPNRREVIIQSIKDGMTIKDLAAQTGWNERTLMSDRKIIAKEEGLEISTKGVALPLGLTKAGSLQLRVHLANHLNRVTIATGHRPKEVATLIGVNRAGQRRAEKTPYAHDWTLSQIERLAKAQSITFQEIMNVNSRKGLD